MAERKSNGNEGCALESCPNHPAILERLAILETTLKATGDAIRQTVSLTENMAKNATIEFRQIKNDITDGILKRHSSGVVAIISVLTGITCALAATLFSHLLRGQ